MEGTLLHDCDHAYIAHDENHSMIKFLWKDHRISHEEFQETLHLYASLIEEKRPKTLYVDAVNQRITISQNLQEWHDQEILPRYHKAGVKKMSFLIPQSIFSELTHKRAFETDQAKELLPTRFFKTETEAMEWLQES